MCILMRSNANYVVSKNLNVHCSSLISGKNTADFKTCKPSYFDSCQRKAGPDHPDLNQCQSQAEADERLLIKEAFRTITDTFL